MKLITLTSAFSVCLAASAAPTVSNVTMKQDASRTVTIGYTLSGEPGIVTVDVRTNAGDNVWVSIGDRHLTHFAGDVNRRVGTGTHTATWQARKAWPDNDVTENVKFVVSAWATNAPPDFMVTSLVVPNRVEFYASAEQIPYGVTNELYKTECLLMRKMPAANVRWRMGSPTTEVGRNATRETPHVVTLADDYYIGVYPVTQRRYQLLMNARPSNFNLDADYMTRPVEQVTFEEIRGKASDGYDWPSNGHAVGSTNFVGVLRTFTGVVGFDLPTEAQWEFACRATCGSALYSGQEIENGTTSARVALLSRYANNGGKLGGGSNPANTCTALNGTAKVGSYLPNTWGLYDMCGNVWEWCLDWYQDAPTGAADGSGPNSGSTRVIRGAAWNNPASNCRCANRWSIAPATRNNAFGFRLACAAVVQ